MVLDDRSHMVRGVAGDVCGVARARGEFARWLQRFSVGEQRRSDVVLAVNEALTNAVEFGFPDRVGRATVTFAVDYDDDTQTLTVSVTDGGRWQLAAATSPTTLEHRPRRGRGIALMRLLTDELRIDTSERGTHVSLMWTDLR